MVSRRAGGAQPRSEKYPRQDNEHSDGPADHNSPFKYAGFLHRDRWFFLAARSHVYSLSQLKCHPACDVPACVRDDHLHFVNVERWSHFRSSLACTLGTACNTPIEAIHAPCAYLVELKGLPGGTPALI